MCDTVVALGNSTSNGTVQFAKNSDREPNESQYMQLFPAADHAAGEMLKCTYVEIPQVEHTFAVLLSRPFWMWGGEMGTNEFGVTIGNEAVFTKVPQEKNPGLIGMDFLRLALERSRSADEALKTLINLLETYGQGGNCGYTHPFFYHNGFIIADTREAWVLETAGKLWAAEKVKDVRSISNALTIGNQWDACSKDLVPYAVDRGWCKSRDDLNFAKAFSDSLYTPLGAGKPRQQCTMAGLVSAKGKITPRLLMSLLRSHGPAAGEDWAPDKPLLGADVCMHAGFGPVRGSQTTASMVSELGVDLQTHWVTSTAAPCTGVFKPIWMDAGMPDTGPAPTGEYDDRCLWWRHEKVHRAILRDYASNIRLIANSRDAFDDRMVDQSCAARTKTAGERAQISAGLYREADELEQNWMDELSAHASPRQPVFYYRAAWDHYNHEAKIH